MNPLRFLALLLLFASSIGFQAENHDTCVLSETATNCEMDYGVVNKGTVLTPWAKIKNVSNHAVTISWPNPESTCMTTFREIPLQPGEVIQQEVRKLNTWNFTGPVLRTVNFQCKPAGQLKVTLYKSYEELLSDSTAPMPN